MSRLRVAGGQSPSFEFPVSVRGLEPGGLPASTSSFVGRAQELADVAELLSTSRLVTLTGPGGCGKTRLALEVARRLTKRYDDGVAFVGLAPLADPGLVVQAVARALDVRESVERPGWESVAVVLSPKQLLLVVDNFEHLLDATDLFSAWIAACPGLTMLATSRERLRLRSESVYPVPPLSLPSAEHPARPAEDAIDSEAVRLFVERAQAVEPGFALTERSAPVVAEICRRLDGLPLAIELAAARVGLLSPDAILDRLRGPESSTPLELLSGTARNLPARQQTLRRTIAWSYDLLNPEEQTLFRRLSVFAGGFTLEQVEAVCAGPAHRAGSEAGAREPASTEAELSILELVSSLLERSLLVPLDRGEDEPRFSMLVTIRELAREQLDASGEALDLRRRHAGHFLGLAEEAAPRLHGATQAGWLDRLDFEHDELRVAMAWCAAHDRPAALRLGGALWRFWQVRGHVREGRNWLEQVLGADGSEPSSSPKPERAGALNAAAFLAFLAGDYTVAIERHREALAIRRALGDRDGVSESLNSLGLVLRCVGDNDAADALFEEALAASRSLGLSAREANILNNLARSAFYRGDYAAAQSLHEQALSVGRDAGEAWAVAICLGDLGDVHQARGDAETALVLYQESLAAWRALGDLRGVAQCLEGFASLIVETRPASAVRLFAAATAVREKIGEPCSPVRQVKLDRMLDLAQDVLGAEPYAVAWTEGQAMAPEQAIEFATEQTVAASSAAPEPDAGESPLPAP